MRACGRAQDTPALSQGMDLQRADLTSRCPGRVHLAVQSPVPTETSQCLSTVTWVSFVTTGPSQQLLPPSESGGWW